MTFVRDDWASERFGVPISRGRWFDEIPRGLSCCLIDADLPGEIANAEEAGFRFRDVRVSFARTTSRFPLEASELPVRAIRAGEVDAIAALASRAHRITRFYADGELPDDACDGFYEAWFRNSVAGHADAVLVVGDPPAGYVTVHGGERASVGLIAVEESRRREGFGLALVFGAVEWAAWNGAAGIEVATQGRDVAAQRLYQRAGFLVEKTEVWLHRWTP